MGSDQEDPARAPQCAAPTVPRPKLLANYRPAAPIYQVPTLVAENEVRLIPIVLQ